jgi:pimeloyl-ACP methyl ester carboxylesterase
MDVGEPEAASADADDRLERAARSFLTPRSGPSTARDEALLRQGTPLELDCGLAATSWGEGPSVLLAHGWNSRRTHWGAFVAALIEGGFRAVAVDAPAHGDSPGCRASVVGYGLGLVDVGREIGPLAGAVGHSFGAAATVIALQRGLEVGRVALLGGPASLASVIARWGRHHWLPESEIPALVRRVEREIGEPIENLDIARIAAELRQPALVVHDRSDEEVPVGDGLAVAAAWPGARALITERYGHRRILVAREVVGGVAAFLKDGSG